MKDRLHSLESDYYKDKINNYNSTNEEVENIKYGNQLNYTKYPLNDEKLNPYNKDNDPYTSYKENFNNQDINYHVSFNKNAFNLNTEKYTKNSSLNFNNENVGNNAIKINANNINYSSMNEFSKYNVNDVKDSISLLKSSESNNYNMSSSIKHKELDAKDLKNDIKTKSNKTNNSELKDREIKELNQNLNELVISESNLRNLVIKKDKLIIDLEKQIKSNEELISKYKKVNLEKDQIIEEIKLKNQELTINNTNLVNKLDEKSSEVSEFISKHKEKIKDINNDRNILHTKVSECTNTIKKYSDINNEMLIELDRKVKEQKNSEIIIKECQDKIINLETNLEKLSSELSSHKRTSNSNEKLKKELQLQIESLNQERNHNGKILFENHELKVRLHELESILNGENSPNKLLNSINSLHEEILMISNQLDQTLKVKSNLECSLKEKDKAIEELIRSIVQELEKTNEWVNTYMTSFFVNKNDISHPPNLNLKTNFTGISTLYSSWDNLKSSLINSRFKSNEQFKDLNQKLTNEKNLNEKLSEDRGKAISDFHNLRKSFIDLEQENYILKSKENTKNEMLEIKEKQGEESNLHLNLSNLDSDEKLGKETIKKASLKLKSEEEKKISLINKICEEILNNLDHPIYSIIESEGLNRIIEILGVIKDKTKDKLSITKANIENQHLKNEIIKLKKDISLSRKSANDEIDKVIKEGEFTQNTLKMKIDSLEAQNINFKSLIYNKDDEIKNILNELNRLKKLNINNVATNNGNFKLENKIENLRKEIELKNIQIQSQEQMLERRNKEIQDLISQKSKENLSINNKFSFNEMSEKDIQIMELEKDKNNLIKDNINLILSNNELKRMLESFEINKEAN